MSKKKLKKRRRGSLCLQSDKGSTVMCENFDGNYRWCKRRGYCNEKLYDTVLCTGSSSYRFEKMERTDTKFAPRKEL